MKKDEILNKARNEQLTNSGEDERSLGVISKAGYYASYAGALISLVFMLADRIKHGNYTLFQPGAIFFTIFGAMFLYRGTKLKRVHEIAAGGVFTFIAAALFVTYLFDFIK